VPPRHPLPKAYQQKVGRLKALTDNGFIRRSTVLRWILLLHNPIVQNQGRRKKNDKQFVFNKLYKFIKEDQAISAVCAGDIL